MLLQINQLQHMQPAAAHFALLQSWTCSSSSLIPATQQRQRHRGKQQQLLQASLCQVCAINSKTTSSAVSNSSIQATHRATAGKRLQLASAQRPNLKSTLQQQQLLPAGRRAHEQLAHRLICVRSGAAAAAAATRKIH